MPIGTAVRQSQPYNAGRGAIWIQKDGPGTPMEYLGCHTMGDIESPEGDVTLIRCPSPAEMEAWDAIGYTREPQDWVTTSIEGKLRRAADALELVGRCPFGLYVYKSDCGRPDDASNFQRVYALLGLKTSISRSNLRSIEGTDESMFSVEISAFPPLMMGFQLTAARVSTAQTRAINSLYISGENRCGGACGAASDAGDTVVAGTDGDSSFAADVLLTDDDGADGFTAFATDPFAAAQNIATVVAVKIDQDTTRYIAALGTTVGGAPAKIAYTDDLGATWTNVSVGSTNGQFFVGPQSLAVYDPYHIWAATSGGYIYFSDDSGATWSTQQAGVIHAGNWNAVHVVSPLEGMAVGATGIVARMQDGATWSAVTAIAATPTLNTVGYSSNEWFVGTATGLLYSSINNGTTWVARTFSGSGSGQVKKVQFANALFGVMAHNTSAPLGRVFYTFNGGESWFRAKNMPANLGINDVVIAGTDKVWAAGEVQGATAFIVKLTPAIA